VCVVAKPAANHKEYREWEKARVVVFVQANDRDEALLKAREFLKRHRWELLHVELCDRLLEDVVRSEGGRVFELFNEAKTNGAAIKVFSENFAAGRNGIAAIRPPKVGETFIDLIVTDVGGARLATDDKNRIVDYQIDNWIFELKDLQQEGLLQPDRQRKLAELFAPYAVSDEPMLLDPSILTSGEQRQFYDILSTPIKAQVKSASKQIRSTKQLLQNENLRGGIIYLNTGYGSFPDGQFGPLVQRYVDKDTTQIEAVFTVSTWAVTNGFETNMFFRAYPEGEAKIAIVNRLKEAFSHRFEEAMTKLITGQLTSKTDYANPLTPIAFQFNGLDFAWIPPMVPLPWKQSK
jgi:hypothetical protein